MKLKKMKDGHYLLVKLNARGGKMKRIILLAAVLILICGCTKETNLFIIGEVYRFAEQDILFEHTQVELFSDPIPDTITVKVNGEVLEPHEPIFGYDRDYGYCFYGNDSLIPGSEYILEVETDVGNANGLCRLPHDFDITSPGDSVASGEALNIAWPIVDVADWYMVWVAFYRYDSTYIQLKDTLIYTDVASPVTIPDDWLDGYGYLSIEVYAGNGPSEKEHSGGNIQGAQGFWIGINCKSKQVTVGTPAALPSRQQERTQKDIIKAYLKRLALYNEEAAEVLEIVE
jgi:hypothetical protein